MIKKYEETELQGVYKIYPLNSFEDYRGTYTELYNKSEFDEKIPFNIRFLQDDCSFSNLNVLRGVHGDNVTWKLISCLYGSIYVVIVCNDETSVRYKQWLSFTISEKNKVQILVPPKHGIGHLVLSERAIFWYKQSTYYDRDSQFTIPWNSSKFNIWWPVRNPIVSERDKGE